MFVECWFEEAHSFITHISDQTSDKTGQSGLGLGMKTGHFILQEMSWISPGLEHDCLCGSALDNLDLISTQNILGAWLYTNK